MKTEIKMVFGTKKSFGLNGCSYLNKINAEFFFSTLEANFYLIKKYNNVLINLMLSFALVMNFKKKKPN